VVTCYLTDRALRTTGEIAFPSNLSEGKPRCGAVRFMVRPSIDNVNKINAPMTILIIGQEDTISRPLLPEIAAEIIDYVAVTL